METLPAGSVCPSGDLEGGEVQAAGQQVGFTLQGASPYPFVVNAPGAERVYSFSGALRDSGRKDTPVGASWGRVTVQQLCDPGPMCAPRTTCLPFLSRRRGSPEGPPCHRRQLSCRTC